jgi:IclR family acetate operon transcriptional repressor
MATDAAERQSGTRAVQRALDLLVAVAGGTTRLTDLAREAGVPTSTGLRLLRTLQDSGFVRRDEGGGFHAGARLMALASVVEDLPLLALGDPHLRALVDDLEETANLGIPDAGGDAVYVAQVQSGRAIRFASWLGRKVPGDASAMGRALRGEVGEDGWTVARDGIEPGVTAVAAPVRGPGGAIVAAVSVTGPSFRLHDRAVRRAGQAVRQHADALSAELGA